MKGTIIQIMQAPLNLSAVYDSPDIQDSIHVLCLALTDQGEVVVMGTNGRGIAKDITRHDSFQRFHWHTEVRL